ncbi:uncharacterized protein BX663DRAFT_535929 [Cokeromyces recurvatus]|uniref:uncharacterized protein n=1 Tax=Cokeromyces recurvatus TaxID=90255 RepID=UPI00221FA66A|nr:uncharacterized protein BX663DRAFT_535929 [Cokeromyces recurvatus]KAI7903909.1 hypothetical protein BX663DRAFT_535929 [Cokeromyces recurvatus]
MSLTITSRLPTNFDSEINKKMKKDVHFAPNDSHSKQNDTINKASNRSAFYTQFISTSPIEKSTQVNLSNNLANKKFQDDIDSILYKLKKLKTQLHNDTNRFEDIIQPLVIKNKEHEERYDATAISTTTETVKPLTDQENEIVDQLFKKGQSGQIAQIKNAVVEFKDIYRLYPETWLNDEIVNFYFELLAERSTKINGLPSIHCFSTFFFSTLQDQGYVRVKRWTKKVDIFAKDLLFIPINQSYHWVLGVIDMKNKKVLVYDSLGGDHDRTLAIFLEYLKQEHLDKKKIPFDTTGWTKVVPKDIPRQGNMSDCGAFTCTFAERLSKQQPFNFSQDDMTIIRRRIALNIYKKEL